MAEDTVSKRIWTIYLVTCVASGKRYVGLTRQRYLSNRWASHLYGARSENPSALQMAINKYGEDRFAIEALCSARSAKDAAGVEAQLISELGTLSPRGYNMTAGGDGSCSEETLARMSASQRGRKHSPETRAKMSAARKGRKPPSWKGKKHTPETREKMSIAGRGRPKTGRAAIGRIVSPEVRERMSKAQKRRRDREHPAKISPSPENQNAAMEPRALELGHSIQKMQIAGAWTQLPLPL